MQILFFAQIYSNNHIKNYYFNFVFEIQAK